MAITPASTARCTSFRLYCLGTPCFHTAQYANFSDWDIYRDVIQFQSLLDPTRSSDMAQSLVNDADQSGWLPRWPAANDVTYVMGGDSPAVLLADAYAFGASRLRRSRRPSAHAQSRHATRHGSPQPI